MSASIAPLCAELWFDRLEKLAAGSLGSLERSLRHACHLLQLSPEPLRPYTNWQIDEAEFESLLEDGDLDAAALLLVAAPIALSFSENDSALRTALIKCEFLGQFVVGRGDTKAEAVLDAWTSCLLVVKSAMDTNRNAAGLRSMLR